MYDCRGKGREFSFGAELARDLETRTKVSETLQPSKGDMDAPWAWGQEIGNGSEPTVGHSSPDSSMGSLSTDLRTWSDSPVRELSSILRSLPWMKRPSAGRRSPGRKKGEGVSQQGLRWLERLEYSLQGMVARKVRPWELAA